MEFNYYNTVRKGQISSDDLIVLQKATRGLLKHGYDPYDLEFSYSEHFGNVDKIKWWVFANCTSNGERFKVFMEFTGTSIKDLIGKIHKIQRENYDDETGATTFTDLEMVK